jgi:small subunit ribosomal protein S10
MSAVKKSSDETKKKPAAKAKDPAVKKPAAPKKTAAKKEEVKATEKAEAAPKAAASTAAKLKGIRIRLSAFDHTVLDEASVKIIDTAMRSGAIVHGPTPLPTKIRKFTVNRSTFVHKDARDQFEMRIHRRLIDLTETTFKTVDALQNLSLPSGVDIEIRMG